MFKSQNVCVSMIVSHLGSVWVFLRLLLAASATPVLVFLIGEWRWEAGAWSWREAKPGRVAPWAATFHFVVMGRLEDPTDPVGFAEI
jgi:hypothetical protein